MGEDTYDVAALPYSSLRVVTCLAPPPDVPYFERHSDERRRRRQEVREGKPMVSALVKDLQKNKRFLQQMHDHFDASGVQNWETPGAVEGGLQDTTFTAKNAGDDKLDVTVGTAFYEKQKEIMEFKRAEAAREENERQST